MTPLGTGQDLVPRRLLARVRRAIDHDEFTVFAEPIVDLATGTVVRHQLSLMLPGEDEAAAPAEPWPVAQRFGLTSALAGELIRQAVAVAGDGHPVAVAIGSGALSDPDLARQTEVAIRDAQIDPSNLCFEIADVALSAGAVGATELVRRLSAAGCPITVGRFGTGYGGFGYLKRLPVDGVKVDAGIIQGVEPGSPDEQLVMAVVHLTRGLGISAAADGVTDRPAAERLEDLGIEQAQGPFFGVPVPLGVALPSTGIAGIAGIAHRVR